jgi:fimbrial chaperone protein
MSMRSRAFLLAALLGSAGSVQAARFVLSPVLLSLDPAQALTTSTTVTNTDTTPAEFTAEVLAWTQQGGQDVLVPTRDALVSPARFTVAPGRSQVVRVALRRAPAGASATYRLVLRQSVQAAPTAGSAVTITPRYVFSLPVFAERSAARPNIAVSAVRQEGGTALVLRNTGDGYGVFRKLQVSAGGRTVEVGNQYVLSGASVTFKLPPELENASTFELSGEDADQRPVRLTVNVQP